MRLIHLLAALGASLLASAQPAQAATPSLTVEGERFVLTLADGSRLTSAALVGAELTTEDGAMIRIDAVAPSSERPTILLHTLSVRDPSTGAWQNLCDKDPQGRRTALPVAGRWDAKGRYVRDAKHWFLACTAGSRAKCILWGYDPWSRGPRGEDLTRFYRACQFTVRADYDGGGEAHTRDGTEIDVADILGIQVHESLANPRFVFEAGWGPAGAVCVAATRWPDLLPREALLRSAPRLGGRCTEAEARRRGALIFTRIIERLYPGEPRK